MAAANPATECITADAAVVPDPYTESRRKLIKSVSIIAPQQAAFVDEMEGHYVDLVQSLSEPLKEVEETNRCAMKLHKEMDETIERLQKERDELTAKLLLTERLQKQKSEIAESLQKEKARRMLKMIVEGHAPPMAAANPATECIPANAAVAPDPYTESRRKLIKLVSVNAPQQAAFVDEMEGHYVDLVQSLFEPLKKAEETNRCAMKLHKEKDETIERLQKERDELTAKLLLTERLQKQKSEFAESLQKEKARRMLKMIAEGHGPSKRRSLGGLCPL